LLRRERRQSPDEGGTKRSSVATLPTKPEWAIHGTVKKARDQFGEVGDARLLEGHVGTVTGSSGTWPESAVGPRRPSRLDARTRARGCGRPV
jgi:hypothetical protein